MFIPWSDPYTWMTLFAVALPLLVVGRLLQIRRSRTTHRKWLMWVLVSVCALDIGSWVYITFTAGDVFGRTVNTVLPDSTFTLADGRQMRLSDLHGKVVVVDFWATWCGPCRMSEPALDHLAEQERSAGVVLLRVSRDRNADKWQRYVATHPSPAFQALDKDDAMTASMGAHGTPSFLVIDREGRLRWRQFGWSPYSYTLLRRAVVRTAA